MQQRTAIARTLANNPKIILMDEPFGSLDAQTKVQMQQFLLEVWERELKTVLFVTHDIREAVLLADTIYILTQRPARIKKTYSVPFSRPRDNNIVFTETFTSLEKEITQALTEEVKPKPEADASG